MRGGWYAVPAGTPRRRCSRFVVTGLGHSGTVEYRQEQQARRSSSTPATGLEAELTSIGFARLARTLIDTATGFGVADVTFRSPGRVGVGRAIRRNADGSATVAVRYRGRPAVSVTADMIEGVVRAAGNGSVDASARDALWRAAGEVLVVRPPSEAEVAAGGVHDHPGSVSDGRSHSSAARRSATGSGFGSPGEGEGCAEQHDRRHPPARRAA